MPATNIKAGEKTRIIHKISNSLATEYKFSVQPANAGDKVSGKIEISGSNWIFPKAPETLKLKAHNTVAKGMWDSIYSVYVTPDSDVTVNVAAGSLNSRFFYIILTIVIIAILAALVPFILS